MLGAIGQFETEIRAERQRDGIAKAKAKGTKFGRDALLSKAQIKDLKKKRKDGVRIKDLMKEYDLSKTSVYRYLSL